MAWIVVEAGRYELPNGAILEAGIVNTAAIRQDGGPQSWQSVTFSAPFNFEPVVLNHIMSENSTAAELNERFGTRMNGPASISGFQVAMENWEGDTLDHTTPEDIGWLVASVD